MTMQLSAVRFQLLGYDLFGYMLVNLMSQRPQRIKECTVMAAGPQTILGAC
jgi:hypothetical protein